MSQKEVHILNGDALRKQLPQAIIGKRIVCREAFIEGPLRTETSPDFWEERAAHYQKCYQIPAEEYQEKSSDEFGKVRQIRRDANVYLWFEHDLFCQCNLWLIAEMLQERSFTGKAYLVLPVVKSQETLWQGFGNHSEEDILTAWNNKFLIAPREWRLMVACWKNYALGKQDLLKDNYEQLRPLLPYCDDVFEAHLGRLEENPRPLAQLRRIKEELNSDKFAPVFQKFCEAEGVYGYGDMQVLKMWEQLNS